MTSPEGWRASRLTALVLAVLVVGSTVVAPVVGAPPTRAIDDRGGTDSAIRATTGGSNSTSGANPPTARFSVSASNVTVGETVTLDASASTDNGTITDYRWAFTTEGTTKNGTVVTHTPNTTGNHVVELTVVDHQGNTNSTTRTITVTANDSTLSLNDTISGTLDDDSPTFGGGRGRLEKHPVGSVRGAVVDLTGDIQGMPREEGSFYLVHDGRFVGQEYRTGPRSFRGVPLAGRDLELWVTGNASKIPASYRATLTRVGSIPLNISQIEYGRTKRSVLGGSDPVREVYPNRETSNRGHYEIVTFRGSAGDVVNVTSVSSTAEEVLTMELRTQSGTLVASSSQSDLDIERATLPETTTYAIEIQESQLSDPLNKYTLTLERAGESGTNDSDTNPPIARFSISETNVTVGETVTLDASASTDDGTITDYRWAFTAEGTTKNGTVVTHAPNTTGNHVVELTVVDDQGNTNSTTRTITATTNGTTRGPPAAFAVSPPNATVGQPVRFEATNGTGVTIDSYEWRFGDGNTSTGRTVTHTYRSNGTYDVTLRVVDARNRTNSTERTVEVDPRSERLIVDDDGGDSVDYERIHPALENASDTATIIVRPGTYTGEVRSNPVGSEPTLRNPGVTVDKNVTLRAPDGATLGGGDDPDAASAGFKIRDGATPTIRGFTVDGYRAGVDVFSNGGDDLTLANLTVKGAESSGPLRGPRGVEVDAFGGTLRLTGSTFADVATGLDAAGIRADVRLTDVRIDGAGTYPILARDAAGNWTLSGVTVSDSGRLEAAGTTGDWTLTNVTLDRTEGVGAAGTGGDWTVRHTTVRNASTAAFAAARASGDWTLTNVTLDRTEGVGATGTGGDWTVRHTTVRNASTAAFAAARASGDWTLTNVTVVSNGGPGVRAMEANGTWTVEGFESVANNGGLVARDTRGDWTLTDAVVERNRGPGVVLDGINGTVHVRNATFVDNAGDGVSVAGGVGGAQFNNVTLLGNGGAGLDLAGATPASSAGRGPGTVVPPGETLADWTVEGAAVTGNSGPGIDADRLTGRAVLRNLSVTDNAGDGLSAVEARDAWTVADATVTGNGGDGIDANATTGEWTVARTNLTDNRVGIDAGRTTGGWTVETVRSNPDRIGIRAVDAVGDWTVRGSVVSGGVGGLVANRSAGDWQLENVRISGHARVGIEAIAATGDWRIVRSTLSNNGIGVDSSDARGAWHIHWSSIENGGIDIAAVGAVPEANARRNYWGPGGDADADCLGNVTCRNPLAAPPEGFQTGLDVRIIDGATGEPLAGSTVYLFDTSVSVRALARDETERLGVGTPRGASRRAAGGTSGRVVFNGLDAREYCLLVVPPGDSPRNVQARCVPVTEDVLTDQRFVLDDTGVESASTTDWNQFQADARNTGSVPAKGPRSGIVEQWEFDLGATGATASPIVYNDTVYVATHRGGRLYAIDADTGRLEWSFDASGPTNGPAAKSGTVYFRAEATLYALDAENGSQRWSSPIENGTGGVFPRSSVTVAEGMVVVPVTRGDGRGGYVAYDVDDGDVVWDQRFQSERLTRRRIGIVHTAATPAVSDGLVYGGGTADAGALKPVAVAVPSQGGGIVDTVVDILGGKAAKKAFQYRTLVAMDGRTGEYVWSQASNTVVGAPTVEDGVVYAPIKTRGKAQLSAYDGKTGDRVESIGASGNIRRTTGGDGNNGVVSSPAVNGHWLYFGDGGLQTANSPKAETALSRIDVREDSYGETTWTLPTIGSHFASPAVTDRTVYLVNTSTVLGSTVIAADKRTGDPLWRYTLGSAWNILAAPAVADESVFVATSTSPADNNKVVALAEWTEGLAAEDGVPPAHDGHVSYLPPGDRYGPTSDDALTGSIRDFSPKVETIDGDTRLYNTTTFTGEAGDTVSVSMRFRPTRGDTLAELASGHLVLLGPDGTRLGSDEMTDAAPTATIPDRTLPESGLYTVVVATDAKLRAVADENLKGLQYGLSVQSPAATRTTTRRDGARAEVDVQNVDPGQRVTVDVPSAVSPRVDRVGVTFAKGVSAGEFEVRTATQRPAGTPAPPDATEPVYLQVDHPNVPDAAIGSGTVTLTLPKSAVDDPGNVTVYRNVGGEWTAVSTTFVRATGDRYRFAVHTPGYSTFAVVTGRPRVDPTPSTGPAGDAGGSGSPGGDDDGADSDGGGTAPTGDLTPASTPTATPTPASTTTPASGPTSTPTATPPPASTTTPASTVTPRREIPGTARATGAARTVTADEPQAREPGGFGEPLVVPIAVTVAVVVLVLVRRRRSR